MTGSAASHKPVTAEDALQIAGKVIERANQRGLPIPLFIVLVGGTALAAHSIRGQSEDVDFYAPEAMDDAAIDVENALKPIYGENFKIDVTVGENLWGDIILRDIATSPEWRNLDLGFARVSVRVLSIEDLLLVKLAANRKKDRDDLPLIAVRTSPDVVISRFNQLVKWHGNRDAVMGYSDSFVIMMNRLYNLPAKVVIDKMAVSDHVRRELTETYCGNESDNGYKG